MDELKRIGKLEELTLPRLLIKCYNEQKTGIIEFSDNDIIKSINMEKGIIIFARSNLKSDRLGAFLIQNEIISHEDMQKAANILLKTGNRLGRILVEMGLLKPRELFSAVRKQIRGIVLSLFTMTSGQYVIHDELKPPEERIVLEQNTTALILEGVRLSIKEGISWEHFVSEDDFLTISRNSVFKKMVFLPEEKLILENLRTPRRYKDIVQAFSREGKTVSELIFCRLFYLGAIKKLQEQSKKASPFQTDVWIWPGDMNSKFSSFSKIFRFLHRYAKMEGGKEGAQIAEKTIAEIRDLCNPLYDNIEPEKNGTVNFEQLKDNALNLPPVQREERILFALNEYFYASLYNMLRVIPTYYHHKIFMEMKSIL